jgi:hypothetical protein
MKNDGLRGTEHPQLVPIVTSVVKLLAPRAYLSVCETPHPLQNCYQGI